MSTTNNGAEPKQTFTILYIEDDVFNRQLVDFILNKRNDVSLVVAENGTKGIESAATLTPQLILLDISLPDMDGYEVLGHLQKNTSTSQIPVVAVSGNMAPSDIQKGMDAGMHGYLGKPIRIKELYSIIDKIIALDR